MNIFFYEIEPIGVFSISANDDAIRGVAFGSENLSHSVYIEKETLLIQKAVTQLREYLSGKRLKFDLPLYHKGTDFQNKVWQALLDIPYGETRSYKEIAEEVGSPRAFRAVGMANHRNPLAFFVPCHRVIKSGGGLGGYAGGIHVKRFLLDLEKSIKFQ
ncbi:MAG: methylated-DNA--[protein]-cysteine S-methyltransferase [Oscillospiraceae bacterium]|nr:methylated-DNA--[protein]-cysteine S-methyltransferase [Oscillospiraceae bacterium]